MKIEIHTDSRIERDADIVTEVTETISSGLARFQDRLTRVEVHLSDINGPRGGIDRRCLLEVRPASRSPISAEHQAGTEREAVRGAVEKMTRQLASTFDRIDDHRGGVSASGLPS